MYGYYQVRFFTINFLISYLIKLFLASTRLLAAEVTKPAPKFAGTAVINNDFKEIKLEDYKGKYLVN